MRMFFRLNNLFTFFSKDFSSFLLTITDSKALRFRLSESSLFFPGSYNFFAPEFIMVPGINLAAYK